MNQTSKNYKDEQVFLLNLDRVLESEELPSYVVKAAQYLKSNNYLSAGEFFCKLDDVEVYELSNAFDNIRSKNYRQFTINDSQQEKDLKVITLLCFLLAAGEGEVGLNPDLLPGLMTNLELLAIVENLYRKQTVEVFHQNYSLFDVSKPIAKKKD